MFSSLKLIFKVSPYHQPVDDCRYRNKIRHDQLKRQWCRPRRSAARVRKDWIVVPRQGCYALSRQQLLSKPMWYPPHSLLPHYCCQLHRHFLQIHSESNLEWIGSFRPGYLQSERGLVEWWWRSTLQANSAMWWYKIGGTHFEAFPAFILRTANNSLSTVDQNFWSTPPSIIPEWSIKRWNRNHFNQRIR